MQKNYRQAGVGMLNAAPGTYLVHAYFDHNEIDVVRCNVIGWQVLADRRLTPLVVDPRAADDDKWTVIHPDGRVECSDGRTWKNEDCWLFEEKRDHRRAAA
ncbi:hypothetical protein OZN62_00615 [Aurantiacibacter sp. MUD11]|uniref:hypothetical protein n=1 Tax=Aurantiacibacter sp. MUD11 TaxID=3003265 RepID=UPI0022AA5305|nr:hypothetical protein [Aurantiacibacter sp. MUD11]WAT18112.1 hypothetical protein OZN62_00615 [Aurantiacibacter sp. MUD11]